MNEITPFYYYMYISIITIGLSYFLILLEGCNLSAFIEKICDSYGDQFDI